MEWVAAIGVASSVLTFVSFAHEGLTLARGLWRDGSPSNHAQTAMLATAMENATKAMESAAAKLSSQSNPAPGSSSVAAGSDHVNNLIEISKQCRADCGKLVALIDELKIESGSTAKGSTSRKAFAVGGAFFKNVSKKPRLEELRRSIDQSRSQALIHLQLILRYASPALLHTSSQKLRVLRLPLASEMAKFPSR